MSDYDAYYKRQADVPEIQILADVRFLLQLSKFDDVERALTAYLKYHGKHAEPWMYETLGTSMEKSRRDPAQIKAAFGWGADLARRRKDPILLIAAADQLALRKYDEFDLPGRPRLRLAEILDLAMDAAPNRPEPILMSMAQAERLRDGKRFGDAMDRLLSLGWPGVDEIWRVGAHQRAVELARGLREDDKTSEADALLARLPEIEARDVVLRLTWSGNAGFDLVVEDPAASTADHFHPRSAGGGTLVKEGRGKDRETVYTCPRSLNGNFTARVEVLYNDPKTPVATADVEIITHEGTPQETKVVKTVPVGKLAPVVFPLTGGRRIKVLPYDSLPTVRLTLTGKPPEDDLPADPKAKATPEKKASTPAPKRKN